MNWLQNWIVTKFLKSFLDKLPANNKKTILGIILLILTALQKAFPDNPVAPLVSAIIEMLVSMGADNFQSVSIGLITTGLIHKLLKYINNEKSSSN